MSTTFESLKAMYYSGKVKPSLNKMLVELEKDTDNLELILLTCQCLTRGKDYKQLSDLADKAIELAPENPNTYYYKGIALKNVKGKEQEALVNFNKSIALEPENTMFLKGKGDTHVLLFSDYHLPPQLAEKHRVKAEDSLMKILDIVESNENPSYTDLLNAGDVSIAIKRNLNAKKFYLKAEKTYEACEETEQNKNIYKDIIKAQKACARIMEKFSE